MVAPAVEFTEDLVAQQRSAIIIYHLGVLGRCYTTQEIAELVGITRQGAAILMDKLSGIHGVPVVRIDGKWLMLVEG